MESGNPEYTTVPQASFIEALRDEELALREDVTRILEAQRRLEYKRNDLLDWVRGELDGKTVVLTGTALIVKRAEHTSQTPNILPKTISCLDTQAMVVSINYERGNSLEPTLRFELSSTGDLVSMRSADIQSLEVITEDTKPTTIEALGTTAVKASEQ